MYSINEILDIAVELEEAGYEFYTKCIDKFEDQVIKDLFTFLADEELVHKELFLSMKQGDENKKGIFTEEYFLYMKSIGGGKIFSDENDRDFDEIITVEDAVKKAFHDEKESILLYSELKNHYSGDTEALALLERIIAEERNHVMKLYDTMKYVKAD